jgi:hypothetical protein
MDGTQSSERLSTPNGNNGYTSANQAPQRPMAQNGAIPRTTSQTSYTPSYMSHVPATSRTDSINIDLPKPSTRSDVTALDAITLTPRGLLLVLVAGEIHPSTMEYLDMLLSRQNFSGLVVATTQEHEVALKKLKMDTFALLGRIQKEVSVSTMCKETWSQIGVEAIVQEITRSGEDIRGVLCCPDFGSSEGADIFEMDAEDLEQSWRKSTAFLHAASRATMASLRAQCKMSFDQARKETGLGPHGPFFLVADSTTHTAASQITKSASNALLHQLEKATKSDGLIVGYTEDLLIPDPAQPEEPEQDISESFPTRLTLSRDGEDEAFPPSESPTKLWNMWANMQNEV